MSQSAAAILALLATSQQSLTHSQSALVGAFNAIFDGKPTPAVPAPREPKASPAPKADKAPSAKPTSNKTAKAEDKAAKRAAMRAEFGPDWHQTYTLHPVTLEARLRKNGEAVETPAVETTPEPKAAPVKTKSPAKKAKGKLAKLIAAKTAAKAKATA